MIKISVFILLFIKLNVYYSKKKYKETEQAKALFDATENENNRLSAVKEKKYVVLNAKETA